MQVAERANELGNQGLKACPKSRHAPKAGQVLMETLRVLRENMDEDWKSGI